MAPNRETVRHIVLEDPYLHDDLALLVLGKYHMELIVDDDALRVALDEWLALS